MALSGLFFLYRIAPSQEDLGSWFASVLGGYLFHFIRGTETPRIILTSHHVSSFFHGFFQWVAFAYTVRLTVPDHAARAAGLVAKFH